mgnify:CR=1 FL=1|tara:strand:- start:2140 stop:2385 length:246 start_codon:yes stop_codon:yes gene_type:complete
MYTTRSGRTVKKPIRYEPPEEYLIDDYKDNEYDSDDVSDIIIDSEDEEDVSDDDDNTDADVNGNLVGFVESDDEESEEDED